MTESNAEIYISDMVIQELLADTEKGKQHLRNVKMLRLKILESSEVALEMSEQLIKQRVIKKSSDRDATHIAYAITSGMDILLSWNFDNIVNWNTIKKIKIFCIENNLKFCDIHPPMEIK